jgi:hypothetical protein
MALDPSLAMQAFTLIASICAAKPVDQTLATCGQIDSDSKSVAYYFCGVTSTSAAKFGFASNGHNE